MAISSRILLVLTAIFVASSSYAADKPEHGFLNRVYKDKDNAEFKYVVFVPESYTGDKGVPLVMFLHGTASSGTDGKKQVIGIADAIKKDEKNFPAIVVFPQARKKTWLPTSEDGKLAMAILAEVEKNYKTDAKRTYLTGKSMGGFGTWSLAAAYPEKWAAIIPICGGGDVKTAPKIKDIPCWAFHGDADMNVKVERSRSMIKAVKEAGGEPKYTEYPGVAHEECWTKAYATKELYDWLWKQQKK